MYDRWNEYYLIMDSWASVVQAIAAVIAVVAGLNYLKQHKEKIEIERKRLASENGLRALLNVDHAVSMLFNINKLVIEDKYQPIKSGAKNKSQKVSDPHKNEAYEICRITGIFHMNYRRDWESLLFLIKEIQLNGILMNETEFEPLLKKYDQSIKNLVDLMNKENDKIQRNGLSDYTYPIVKEIIPLTHSDNGKEVIKDCDWAGKNLKEFFQKSSK